MFCWWSQLSWAPLTEMIKAAVFISVFWLKKLLVCFWVFCFLTHSIFYNWLNDLIYNISFFSVHHLQESCVWCKVSGHRCKGWKSGFLQNNYNGKRASWPIGMLVSNLNNFTFFKFFIEFINHSTNSNHLFLSTI